MLSFKKYLSNPIFVYFSIIIISLILISNAAQPGIWNAGGGGYHLLYPEDSINFKKIQMKAEKISIQLYKGFAVVKGEYQMANEMNDTIKVKVGYPVDGIYDGNSYGKLNQVTFDDLYKLKALQNGELLPIIETPIKDPQDNTTTFDNDNWFVWENTFLPESTTDIAVYFIVNTNNAIVREGYTKNKHNAFIYLLESGSVWKQPIENGSFKVSLMNGLDLEDLHGISDLQWKYDSDNYDNHELYASKLNFSPTPKENIVINYGKKVEAFDFESVIKNSDHYFVEIDRFSRVSIPANDLDVYEANDPYDTRSSNLWYLFLFLGIIAILGLFLLVIWMVKLFLKSTRK